MSAGSVCRHLKIDGRTLFFTIFPAYQQAPAKVATHPDKALDEGVPIATGVIEGTCRHLVEDRMNLTGARWSLTGAEAVLRLRALCCSDDFAAYWEFRLLFPAQP